jgi:hypothetical protein
MEQNDDGDSRVDIFNLFLKWKDTPKNEQASLAIRLKEKISDTIPESYGIKIEECNMRYFVLLTDSDFVNCKTQPFTCVYEFANTWKAFTKHKGTGMTHFFRIVCLALIDNSGLPIIYIDSNLHGNKSVID